MVCTSSNSIEVRTTLSTLLVQPGAHEKCWAFHGLLVQLMHSCLINFRVQIMIYNEVNVHIPDSQNH